MLAMYPSLLASDWLPSLQVVSNRLGLWPAPPESSKPSKNCLRIHPDIWQSPVEGTCLATFTGCHGGHSSRRGLHGSQPCWKSLLRSATEMLYPLSCLPVALWTCCTLRPCLLIALQTCSASRPSTLCSPRFFSSQATSQVLATQLV